MSEKEPSISYYKGEAELWKELHDKVKQSLSEAEAKYDKANKTIPPTLWEERKAKDEALERLAECQAELGHLNIAYDHAEQDLESENRISCIKGENILQLQAVIEAKDRAFKHLKSGAAIIHTEECIGNCFHCTIDQALLPRLPSKELDAVKLEAVRRFAKEVDCIIAGEMYSTPYDAAQA